jgi:hypothetical protein
LSAVRLWSLLVMESFSITLGKGSMSSQNEIEPLHLTQNLLFLHGDF